MLGQVLGTQVIWNYINDKKITLLNVLYLIILEMHGGGVIMRLLNSIIQEHEYHMALKYIY